MRKKKDKPRCIIERFPPERYAIVDLLNNAKKHPTIYGFLELDVTKARKYIQEYKEKTGEQLSFTGFIVYCMANAIDENKRLHARRKGKNKLVIFDEVDIMTIVEREFEGKKAPIGYVVRAANKKSYKEIHDEIRTAQISKLGATMQTKTQLQYKKMPWFIKKAIWRKVNKDPYFKKKFSGTCSLTAIGMFGEGTGYGLTPSGDTIGITLGGIGEKPAVIDGKIVIREFLSITVGFDHDIVDGAPATRFTMRLKELIESGFGLIPE